MLKSSQPNQEKKLFFLYFFEEKKCQTSMYALCVYLISFWVRPTSFPSGSDPHRFLLGQIHISSSSFRILHPADDFLESIGPKPRHIRDSAAISVSIRFLWSRIARSIPSDFEFKGFPFSWPVTLTRPARSAGGSAAECTNCISAEG